MIGETRNLLAFLVMVILATVLGGGCGRKSHVTEAKPIVIMETSEGTIRLELWADKMPVTAKNFLRYVDEGFYDGTIFHRVIEDFVLQGGGLTATMGSKPAHEPIENEAQAELRNIRGTIAMARTSEIHSATSQFFINLNDNHGLDRTDDTPEGFGYAVFGRVVGGMDVVDRIGSVKTKSVGPFSDVPVTPVVIEAVKRAKE